MPNVFRTRFVDESQLAEELGELNARQGVGQVSDALGKTLLSTDKKSDPGLDEILAIHRIYGPELP